MVIKEERHGFFSWKWFIGLVVLAVLIYVIWFFFFSYAECGTWACFNNNLDDCSKTKFIGKSEGMIYEYIIEGSNGGRCEVNIELLQGELNNVESKKLEGHDMLCKLPEGVVMTPESDIGNCHGLLKEGLQDLIIKRLHVYLVQNLGQLNLEVLDIPEVS